jgi:Flp pilus assembly pilin Flp
MHNSWEPALRATALAFVADQYGQDAVEYGLIIATVAIMVLMATTAFGAQIQAWFSALTGRITTT